MQTTAAPSIQWPLKVAAEIISYLFHPLFVPVYAALFFTYVHPYLLTGLADDQKTILVVRFAIMYVLFPLVTVLLLVGLKFVKSLHLHTRQERVIPYVACGIYYFWMWYTLKNQQYPAVIQAFAFPIFLSGTIAVVINTKIKISMHMIGLGILLTVFGWLSFDQNVQLAGWVALITLITGLTATARLLISDHTQTEIYTGFFLGVFCQLVSLMIIA